MNIEGSLTNEAVLTDPETIEWMGSRSKHDDGPYKERIFLHTKTVSLLKTAVEVKIGKSLPRPVIPGLELRVQRNVLKTRDAVAKGQKRNASKADKAEAKRNRILNRTKGQ